MPKYILHQNEKGEWYLEDLTLKNLGSILYYPKNRTLAECLKILKRHEKIYSKVV